MQTFAAKLDTWDRTNEQRGSRHAVCPSVAVREPGSGGSRCSHSSAQSAERRRGKYPPVHTMVLLGLQAPLLGEHSAGRGGGGGGAGGGGGGKTSPAAGIKKSLLGGGGLGGENPAGPKKGGGGLRAPGGGGWVGGRGGGGGGGRRSCRVQNVSSSWD